MSLRTLVAMMQCKILGMTEYARQQQAIDARAEWLRRQRLMSVEDARLIVRFVLYTWAQRYPVASYDLGRDAALFIADWLTARHIGPTDDNLHAARAEWRAHKIIGTLAALSLQAKAGAVEIRTAALLFRDLGPRLKRGARHAKRPPTRGYWVGRCRCCACRKACSDGES